MIPTSIKESLTEDALSFYTKAFVSSYDRLKDEAVAQRAAWEITKSHLHEFNKVEVLSFAMEAADEVIIKNTTNDEIELDIVLANTAPRVEDGKYFTPQALEQLAEQINMDGSTEPDFDHEELGRLQAKYGNDYEAIERELRRTKGVFKSIKAIVRDGKLWVRALLDKRYRARITKDTGVSIEARSTVTPDKQIIRAKYLGFTFTDKKSPQLAGTGIAA